MASFDLVSEIEICFRFVTSVRQRNNSESPLGIKPQTFNSKLRCSTTELIRPRWERPLLGLFRLIWDMPPPYCKDKQWRKLNVWVIITEWDRWKEFRIFPLKHARDKAKHLSRSFLVSSQHYSNYIYFFSDGLLLLRILVGFQFSTQLRLLFSGNF